MFPELRDIYAHRDYILSLICDHRNTTYFPTITIVPGEPFPRYSHEYVVPEQMAEALRHANEHIERETLAALNRHDRLHQRFADSIRGSATIRT